MSNEEEKQPKGFFGRILGGAGGGGKKAPQRANLGEPNQLVYDKELRQWRMPGAELPAGGAGAPPPPPTARNQAATQSSTGAPAGGRYAAAGSFGSASVGSAVPSFMPPSAQSQSAAFQPPQGAAKPNSGGPNFFMPGGQPAAQPLGGSRTMFFTPSAGSQPAVPSWGAQSAGQPAAGGKPVNFLEPRSSNPNSQVSPTGNDGKTPRTPNTARSNTSQMSSREPHSWTEWRQQDQENRERERQLANEIGAQVMEALNEDGLETHDASQLNITSSFNDLEDQPIEEDWLDQEAPQNSSTPTGESSTTFGAWNALLPSSDSATSSTQPAYLVPTNSAATNAGLASNLPPVSTVGASDGGQTPAWNHPQPQLRDEFGHGLDDSQSAAVRDPEGGGGDVFGEMSGDQDFSSGTYQPADGLDEAMGPSIVPDSELLQPQPQTYAGGYSAEDIEYWAQEYRNNGESEEFVQNFIATSFSQPDPPGFVYQPEPQEEQNEGQDLVAANGWSPEESDTHFQHESTVGNGDLDTQQRNGIEENLEGYPEAQEVPSNSIMDTHDSIFSLAISDQTTFPLNVDGGFVKQHSEQPGMDKIAGLQHLKEMLEEQKKLAGDPGFGKLTGPLAWDGVISDQEETPHGSPKAFLAPNSKRRKSKLGPVSPEAAFPGGRSQSAPVDQAAIARAKKLPKSHLGAGWLDRFGEKLLVIEQNRERKRQSSTTKELSEIKEEPQENGAPGPILPGIRTDLEPRKLPEEQPGSDAGVETQGQPGSEGQANAPGSRSIGGSPRQRVSSPRFGGPRSPAARSPRSPRSARAHLAALQSPRAPSRLSNVSHNTSPLPVPGSNSPPETPKAADTLQAVDQVFEPTPANEITPAEANEPQQADVTGPKSAGESDDLAGEDTALDGVEDRFVTDVPASVEDISSAVASAPSPLQAKEDSEPVKPVTEDVSSSALLTQIRELEQKLEESLAKQRNAPVSSQDQEALQQRIAALEAERQDLKKQADDNLMLKARMYEYLEQIKALEQESTSLKAILQEKETLLAEKDALKAELQTLQDQLQAQNASTKDGDAPPSEIANLEEQIFQLESEKEDLENRLSAQISPDTLERLQKDADELRVALESIQGEKEELLAAAKTGEDSQQTLLRELETVANELDFSKRRQSELEQAADNSKDVNSRLEVALQEVGSLREEIANLREGDTSQLTSDEIAELRQKAAELDDLKERASILEQQALEAEDLRKAKQSQAEELELLAKELEDLQQRNMDLEDENEAYLSTVDALNEARDQLTSKSDTIQSLQDEREATQQQLAAFESDLAKLQNELESAQTGNADVSELTEKYNKLETEHRELREKARKLRNLQQKQKKEATEKQEALEKELNDLKMAGQGPAEASEQAAALQLQLDDALSQSKAYKAQIDSQQAEIDNLHSGTEGLSSQIASLEQDLDSARSTLQELQSMVDASKSELEEKEQLLSRLQSELSVASSQVQDLQIKFSETKNRLSASEEEAELQAGELADAQALAESAASERDEAVKAAEKASLSLREAESRIQKLTDEIAAVEAGSSTSADKLAQLQSALAESESQLQESKASEARIQSELQNKSDLLLEARQIEQRLTVENEAKSQQLRTSEHQLNSLADELLQLKESSTQILVADQNDSNEDLLAEKASLEETVEELMACLGQEDEKIQMLISMLQQHGIDPSDQLAEIEARYLEEQDVSQAEETETAETDPLSETQASLSVPQADAESATSPCLPDPLQPVSDQGFKSTVSPQKLTPKASPRFAIAAASVMEDDQADFFQEDDSGWEFDQSLEEADLEHTELEHNGLAEIQDSSSPPLAASHGAHHPPANGFGSSAYGDHYSEEDQSSYPQAAPSQAMWQAPEDADTDGWHTEAEARDESRETVLAGSQSKETQPIEPLETLQTEDNLDWLENDEFDGDWGRV